MKEEIYYVADSLGVMQPMTIERPDWSIARFFVEGGAGAMTIISILLIALFIAAWKAPKWVKEIGLGALVVSVFCRHGAETQQAQYQQGQPYGGQYQQDPQWTPNPQWTQQQANQQWANQQAQANQQWANQQAQASQQWANQQNAGEQGTADQFRQE